MPKGTFWRRGINPRDRAIMDNLQAEMAAEKQRNADLESALVELAELYSEQDDAIVELAEMLVE